MKLGVSYNIFDGEELLEGSIKQIRPHVDYISVVYQVVSNFGNPCNPELVPLLERLKSEGLVDELFEYNPKINKGGHSNEIQKRNIGLALSQGAGCTHHMSMDSDEYYITSEFENLKKLVEDGDYDSSFCQMQTYFKSPSFEIRPLNDYYVSLIFKIKNDSNFVMMGNSPVVVDPTRRINPIKNPLILKRSDIEMYHMSYVRKNIKSKLINSSSKEAFKDIDGFLKMFQDYKLGETFFTTTPPGNEKTIFVENKFNIEL
jgi:hypothetical protein